MLRVQPGNRGEWPHLEILHLIPTVSPFCLGAFGDGTFSASEDEGHRSFWRTAFSPSTTASKSCSFPFGLCLLAFPPSITVSADTALFIHLFNWSTPVRELLPFPCILLSRNQKILSVFPLPACKELLTFSVKNIPNSLLKGSEFYSPK